MEDTLAFLNVVEVRKALPPHPNTPAQSLPPNDPSLPVDDKFRLNLQVWSKVLHEPIKTQHQQRQRIRKILNFFVRVGILNNLESTFCVKSLKDALGVLESGADISKSKSTEPDWKAKIVQLTVPVKTDYERVRNLRELVIHGVPLFNIWDSISFLYTVCAEDIKTALEAQLHLLQFRIIILSLREASDYFRKYTKPTAAAATWTRPSQNRPLNIAFATTAVGNYRSKEAIAIARREFMSKITRELKKISPSADTQTSRNRPGNCHEYITWGVVCRGEGKYSTLCLTMDLDPKGKIYKCCSHCEDLRQLLNANGMDIEDLWEDSELGYSESIVQNVKYPCRKLKPLKTILAEFGI